MNNMRQKVLETVLATSIAVLEQAGFVWYGTSCLLDDYRSRTDMPFGYVIALVLYVGLLTMTYAMTKIVPTGFIPEQDKGYLVVNAQLPDGAALGRSDAIIAKLSGGHRDEAPLGCREVSFGVARAERRVGRAFELDQVAVDVDDVCGRVTAVDPAQRRGGGVPAGKKRGDTEAGVAQLADRLVHPGERALEVLAASSRGA